MQSLDDVDDSIGAMMDVAADLTVRHLADRTGLSAGAAMLLNRLAQEGPARLTTLACLEGTSQPAMTQMIQRLERQGLVERSGDPDDGRAAIVSLAPDAQMKLDDRTVARRGRLADMMTALSSEDEFSLALAAQVALPILRRLSEHASAATADRRQAVEAGCLDGDVQA